MLPMEDDVIFLCFLTFPLMNWILYSEIYLGVDYSQERGMFLSGIVC